jgi:hypothetical protein
LNNKGIDEEPEENSVGEGFNKYASCQPNAGQKRSLKEEVKFA